VVEIGSGMNFWDVQQWSPSVAEFGLTEDAFVADRVQHRKRLNADLNVIGAVTTTLKDGTVLRSTPVAIALYDPNDGRFAVLSTITNSVGVLVDSNRVVYPDAFSGGVCADVVYTLQKGSFEQDLIITGRLNPLDYGFPTNAQIQVVTEFYDPPQPEKLRQPLYVEMDAAVRRRKVSPDLVDEMVGFGELVIGPGQAYTPRTATHPEGTQTAVAKEFRTIPSEGRTFLIETVECTAVQEALNALPEGGEGKRSAQLIRDSQERDGYAFIRRPAQAVQAKVEPRKASGQFVVTPSPQVTGSTGSTGIPAGKYTDAAASEAPTRMSALPVTAGDSRAPVADHRPGVVIDYIETLGGNISGAKVFQGDTTYLVDDPVYCNGPVTIEGCAVFKYWNSTGNEALPPKTTFLQLNNTLTLKTGPYRPAIFTALDDNSVGEVHPWSMGDPTQFAYANPAIIAANSLTLTNCRFSYAKLALKCTGYGTAVTTVSHSQFINCVQGFSLISSGGSGSGSGTLQVTANNCLLANVSYLLDGSSQSGPATMFLTQCTVTNATKLVGPGTALSVNVVAKNSIFSDVDAWGISGYYSMSGSYNGFHQVLAPV
jgi:hypothetical protein